MGLIAKLKPINLEVEKEKFFSSPIYQPQFQYSTKFTVSDLLKYGLPTEPYLSLARTIVDETLAKTNFLPLANLEGPAVNQAMADKFIADFLAQNSALKNCQVYWSTHFLGRASYYRQKLRLKLPLNYHQAEFLGMLNHELGTHALRWLNHQAQTLFKSQPSENLTDYLRTEEGLADLHSALSCQNQVNYETALSYLSVGVAQKSSFRDTFNFLAKYLQNQERIWQITVKHKRGLTDTSQPGGFSKGVVYFEGFVQVWQYLKQHQFNPTQLYLGKIALADLPLARALNPDYQPILPSFYVDNPQQYQEKIAQIGLVNHLDELPPLPAN